MKTLRHFTLNGWLVKNYGYGKQYIKYQLKLQKKPSLNSNWLALWTISKHKITKSQKWNQLQTTILKYRLEQKLKLNGQSILQKQFNKRCAKYVGLNAISVNVFELVGIRNVIYEVSKNYNHILRCTVTSKLRGMEDEVDEMHFIIFQIWDLWSDNRSLEGRNTERYASLIGFVMKRTGSLRFLLRLDK